jgi:hypothetical protein
VYYAHKVYEPSEDELTCTLVIPTDSEQTANDVEGIVLALKDQWK